MSFFYLSPVKGELPVHLLEVILDSRLEHLKRIFKGEPVIYNEYVVEGSIHDNVGHFMLCIITILSKNREFIQFFLKTELEQFKLRIASLTAYEMRLFSKKLLRTIKKYENASTYIDSLQTLCRHLMLKNVAQHICSTCSVNNCNVYNISLRFTHCLQLVARRQVELKNGNAIIPCGRWKQYLFILFSNNLKRRIIQTNLEPLYSDPRIMTLLKKVQSEFSLLQDKTHVLVSKDVDIASAHFPPCMLNLHRSLRVKHRLSHSQRFYYSLFLKDIGMPVEEAINFWRTEYRLHPNGHSCCHNWEKDEKKYLYGIRHMYGLEGCKKNYTSLNCQRIQSMDSACSEGGCPFKCFDNSKMVPLLKNCTETVLSQINELKNKHLYTPACMLFLQKSHLKTDEKNNCDSSYSFNFTPVKYYMTACKVSNQL